ncbi:hypothetical protein DERF_008227 [Dermatophagoides farinae]|uniref:P-type domain-containing protein n=2 Tax=Dermatophagoides farinae TaxID=6954 RepID=A0A922I3Z2_DERFA|nr:hypothetical protein DERF_008227 [Dermatophagoides farinae]
MEWNQNRIQVLQKYEPLLLSKVMIFLICIFFLLKQRFQNKLHMMSHSQFNHKRLKNDPEFESIMDFDNVELFNRDTLYYPHQRSWLSFIHEQRLEFQRVLAIVRYNQNVENDSIKTLDDEAYIAQMKIFEQCQLVRPEDRIDCNPDPPISKEICEKRGCCWNPIKEKYSNYTLRTTKALPPVDIPFCYFDPIDHVGYKIIENRSEETHTYVHLKRVHPSGFPGDIQNVKIDIYQLTDQMIRIKFSDLENPRFEVPVPKLKRTLIRRRENGQAVFHVNLALLIYSDQFIQMTTRLPSDFVYGLGEHREPFRKPTNWKRYTMFNRDQYPLPDMALYGSHPFYMTVEEYNDKRPASGVFLFNSNAMDIITQPQPAITFRTIGGILDFFLFFGPKAEDVVCQYHNLIGLPLMPPFWSLGFHLSRFGYRNMSNLLATFTRNRDVEIPMDVQWTDIDIMDSNNDFTYDEKNFKGLPDFINKVLHKNGMKFIPMFDPGISAGEAPNSYQPFDVGLQMNVFIKNSSDHVFYGKVWNRKSTVWPDFFHPNATLYWTRMLSQYHKTISFDGAWIDMNEPSNFLDGQNIGCPKNDFETPPYTPGMVDESLTLKRKTLCMTARHYNGQLHYNLHNLYGLQEAIVTNDALKNTLKKRPFIISRATAPGHGHWAYHWTGDIVSDWSSMNWSISSILNFNLFGIPMVGADICGFNGNTTEELCARWHQLGAFYTFARNHNTDDGIDQDPAALGPHVVQAAKNALRIRYAHLSYLYTLFYNVHKNGGTVLRPLFFEFSDDENAYKIDSQFISMYIFPKGTWFFVGDYQRIEGKGQFMSMPALFTYPNVYYRSGSIIPIQKPNITSEATRQEPFSLLVILENELSAATGQLYLDAVKNQNLNIESKHLGYRNQSDYRGNHHPWILSTAAIYLD